MGVRKFGTTIKSNKTERVSVLPTPQPLGLLEQHLIADGGEGLQGPLQGNISLGRGDSNSRAGEQNQMHNVPSGKRLTDIPPILDSPARPPIQVIGNNQQANQALCGIWCRK